MAQTEYVIPCAEALRQLAAAAHRTLASARREGQWQCGRRLSFHRAAAVGRDEADNLLSHNRAVERTDAHHAVMLSACMNRRLDSM